MSGDGYDYLMSRLPSGGQLAQGSAPPAGVRIPFDTIVLAAMEYQPELPGYHVMHVPLDDGPPPDARTRKIIDDAATEMAKRIRVGHRVLSTCWQGRNRSGVLSGLTLVKLGYRNGEAVRRIRALRDGLTNPHFRAMVAGAR